MRPETPRARKTRKRDAERKRAARRSDGVEVAGHRTPVPTDHPRRRSRQHHWRPNPDRDRGRIDRPVDIDERRPERHDPVTLAAPRGQAPPRSAKRLRVLKSGQTLRKSVGVRHALIGVQETAPAGEDTSRAREVRRVVKATWPTHQPPLSESVEDAPVPCSTPVAIGPMPVGPYRRSEQRRCAFRREIAAAPTLQGAASDLTDVLRVSKSFRTRLRDRRWSFSTQAGGFAPLHSARRVRQDPTRRRSRNHKRHEREYRHP